MIGVSKVTRIVIRQERGLVLFGVVGESQGYLGGRSGRLSDCYVFEFRA